MNQDVHQRRGLTFLDALFLLFEQIKNEPRNTEGFGLHKIFIIRTPEAFSGLDNSQLKILYDFAIEYIYSHCDEICEIDLESMYEMTPDYDLEEVRDFFFLLPRKADLSQFNWDRIVEDVLEEFRVHRMEGDFLFAASDEEEDLDRWLIGVENVCRFSHVGYESVLAMKDQGPGEKDYYVVFHSDSYISLFRNHHNYELVEEQEDAPGDLPLDIADSAEGCHI